MRLLRSIVASVAFLAILPPIGGCLSPSAELALVGLWAVPESAVVLPDAEPELENEVYTDAGRTIRVASAINEIISFQIALRGGKSPVSIRNFTPSDLRQGEQVIPARQIRFYREVRVPVTDYPAWYLRLTPELRARREYGDVLVPLAAPKGGLPIEVRPGRTEAVWVDVLVPPGTPPGIYQGTLQLGGGGRAVREVGLSVEVWGFALPQTRHLAMVAGLNVTELLRHHVTVGGQPYAPLRLSAEDPAYMESVTVIEESLRTLQEARLSPVLTDVYPSARLRSDGRQELDWADYDRLVVGAVEGTLYADRAPAAAWPLPISARHPPPETYGGWGSRAYRAALAEYLRQSVAHFREKGWFDRHFAWVPLPGADCGRQYEEFDQLARVLTTVEPRVNLLCALTPQSMAPYGRQNDPFRDVSALVGTWCPPASMADPAELDRVQRTGKAIWFTPDRPPFAGSLSLLAPGLHARSIAWQAYRFGCTGVLLPEVNEWASDGQPRWEGSEAALLWPGKPFGLAHPVSSVRLKRLLRGLQDYEYLWLLEKNGRPAVAQLIAADLFAFGGTQCYGEHYLDGRPNGWMADARAWSLARRLMARELLAAMAEQQTGASEKVSVEAQAIHFEQQIEWARLTEAVRGVRAEVEGVRVELDPREPRAPVRLEPAVCVFNGTREPFTGRLSLAGTPEGWKLEGTGVAIDRLEPRRWARRTFAVNGPALVPNADGVFELQVGLGRENAEPTMWPARVCALKSQRLARAITMDGRLDDWPLGTINVAGDFVLVGARDVPKRGTASPDRPSQQTVVFVCHDSDYVYFAFNCAEQRLAERVISRGNTVQYDDLWPVGEDLVEVVLDPTHRAVDSGGLLHFVVKANGAVISEQGVPCLSAVARHSAWPAGVEAKLDDTSQKDRWTVEMRIPLKALAGKPGVWGVNFGRFNARLGEYSSWSGARRYLYSPASLGNMRVE